MSCTVLIVFVTSDGVLFACGGVLPWSSLNRT